MPPQLKRDVVIDVTVGYDVTVGAGFDGIIVYCLVVQTWTVQGAADPVS